MFLSKKSETKSILPTLLKQIENEQDVSIIKIQSHQGGEFVNHAIEAYFNEHGILHQLSVALTPQTMA